MTKFNGQRLGCRWLGGVGLGLLTLLLVEKASETLDKDEAEKIAAKMKKGQFDMNDLKSQLNQMKKLGGMKGVLGMLPGVGKIKDQLAPPGSTTKSSPARKPSSSP